MQPLAPTGIVIGLTSSRGKYRQQHKTLWINCGGLHVTNRWLSHTTETAVRELLSKECLKGEHGHSGNKRTMDPKYHWSNYPIESERSDRMMQMLFGSTLEGEINRRLRQDAFILYKKKYCLPEKHLSRFIRSRHRDRTWCDCLRLHQAPATLAEYIKSLQADEIDPFWETYSLNVPAPLATPRRLWKCTSCGLTGNYEEFRERSVPGLAGSTGLDCPKCPQREVAPEIALIGGTPRGEVIQQESRVVFPAA